MLPRDDQPEASIMTLALVGRDPEATFYARQVARHGSPVLMLGCGNGRFAFDLVSRGASVVAVDPSKVMIHSAEERKASERLAGVDQLRFLVADLRALRLSETFPLVLAPQNALSLMGSMDELGALLATVRHHLEPNGTFVCDLAGPSVVGLGPLSERPQSDDGHGPVEPAGLELLRPPFTPHLRERRRGPKGDSDRAIHRLRLRHFTPDEIDEALKEAGFVALERYGDFEGKAYDDGDPVQVVLASRATGPSP
jgi:SAM-dependent methyltransferase